MYPQKSSTTSLVFQKGQKQFIYCAGGEITRKNKPTNRIIEQSNCLKSQTFYGTRVSESFTYNFVDITCSDNPKPMIRSKVDNRICRNGLILNIGYQITNRTFNKLIDLCFLPKLATTLWAHSKIVGSIFSFEFGKNSRPKFRKGPYFNDLAIDQIYTVASQKRRFTEIFKGNKSLVDHYMNGKIYIFYLEQY